MKALADTSVLINLLKGDEVTEKKVRASEKEFLLCTTSINVYEALKGFHLHQKHKEIFSQSFDFMLSNMHVFDFDWESASKAAEIYSELRQKGKPIDEPDYMIAGCALANGVNTILTGNKKHFEHINGLKVIAC